ncbi:MAG: DUF58 domain-containing protein [Nitrospinae bacterium]|nr:DUF58 domain-containing protein [Nitrospinota bacterium]
MLLRLLYHHFRMLSSLRHRLGRRLTKSGVFVMSGLVASAVLGVDTNQTVAYQAFTFLLAMLVISVIWSALFRTQLSVRRIMPRYGSVGEPLAYRIVAHNPTHKTLRGLTVVEGVGDPRPSLEQFIHTPDAGAERPNWFDRTIGYSRWLRLLSSNREAIVAEQPLPPLPPHAEGEVRLDIIPLRRGHMRLSGVTVARADPLGLCRGLVTVPAKQSLLVLPKRYPLPSIQLPGTRKYQQGGVALAGSVGDSEEFVSLRDYRPGDPLRRMHWKSWARVGKPIVKEYQDEFFVRHALVLDTFMRTERHEIFEEATAVAASFACSIQTQESLLDLMFVGPQAYCVTTGRGLGDAERMLEILACVLACRDQEFSVLHHLVIERCASLSGCICILLGWDDARQDFIRHLQRLRVPTLVLLITEAGAPDTLPPGPTLGTATRVQRLEIGRIAAGLAHL